MEQVFSKDGTRIVYETTGTGRPLILVDGAMCHRSMKSLAEMMSSNFTVCSYDRRGRGESGDTQPYSVQREVEDLDALIDTLGGRAYVYGISSGAVLALKAAAALGDCIGKLAIYEPPFTFGDEARKDSEAYTRSLEGLLSQGRRDDAVELFMRKVGMPPEAIAGMRQAPAWAAMTALAPTLAYDDAVMGDGSVPVKTAEAVRIPTLVLDGSNSPAFMHEAADSVAEALPFAQRDTLQGQSHDVDAKVLAPLLKTFLEDEG